MQLPQDVFLIHFHVIVFQGITLLRPIIIADAIMVNSSWGENIYYCDLQPLSEPLYQVEWTLTRAGIRERFLSESDFIQHESRDAFRQATALREHTLRNNNVTQIGYTVSNLI